MASFRPSIYETGRLPRQKCSVWPQGASEGGVSYTPPPIRRAIWLKFAHSLAFGMVIAEIHVCRSKVVAFVLGAWYKGGGVRIPPPYTDSNMDQIFTKDSACNAIHKNNRPFHQSCGVHSADAFKICLGGSHNPYTVGYMECDMAQICTFPRFWDGISRNRRLMLQSCSVCPWGAV